MNQLLTLTLLTIALANRTIFGTDGIHSHLLLECVERCNAVNCNNQCRRAPIQLNRCSFNCETYTSAPPRPEHRRRQSDNRPPTTKLYVGRANDAHEHSVDACCPLATAVDQHQRRAERTTTLIATGNALLLIESNLTVHEHTNRLHVPNCATRRHVNGHCAPRRRASSAERTRTQPQKTKSCAAAATRTKARATLRNSESTSPPGKATLHWRAAARRRGRSSAPKTHAKKHGALAAIDVATCIGCLSNLTKRQDRCGTLYRMSSVRDLSVANSKIELKTKSVRINSKHSEFDGEKSH
jgi:hypothetical protein